MKRGLYKKKMSSTVISITRKSKTSSVEDVEERAANILSQAQIYFSVGAALLGYTQLLRTKELTLEEADSLKALMDFVDKTGKINRESPLKKKILVKDFTPGGRVFRKTAEQLAHAYRDKLQSMGLFASVEDIVAIIKGKTPPSVVTTLVEGWIEDEKKEGVEIC